MKGTLRALDENMRTQLRERVTRIAAGHRRQCRRDRRRDDRQRYGLSGHGQRSGADRAHVADDAAGGRSGPHEVPAVLGAEDFSYYGEHIRHSTFSSACGRRARAWTNTRQSPPRFKIDESGLKLGMRTLANLTVDYMSITGSMNPVADGRDGNA